MNNFESYLFGLLMTDGSLNLQERNRGKVTLELQKEDSQLLQQIYEKIPNSSLRERTRDTNFKEGYVSTIWSNSQLEFRTWLIDNGFPIEEKTWNACPPSCEFSIKDFWRGAFDGDGSLGFIKDGSPFMSFTTKSEVLKTNLLELLKTEFGIVKNINRNKRDNIYNITIKNEDAQDFAHYLYDNCEIAMPRKYQKAQEIFSWVRTKVKTTRRTWLPKEDDFILNHSVQESMRELNRTESSIKNRLFRLNKSIKEQK